MSPVDSYYVIYDALSAALGLNGIRNDHPLSKHMGLLLRLANRAEHGEEE